MNTKPKHSEINVMRPWIRLSTLIRCFFIRCPSVNIVLRTNSSPFSAYCEKDKRVFQIISYLLSKPANVLRVKDEAKFETAQTGKLFFARVSGGVPGEMITLSELMNLSIFQQELPFVLSSRPGGFEIGPGTERVKGDIWFYFRLLRWTSQTSVHCYFTE